MPGNVLQWVEAQLPGSVSNVQIVLMRGGGRLEEGKTLEQESDFFCFLSR